MVGRAQRLPVATPPEQRLVPAMRGDVVNNRCRLDPALRLAHEAQRVLAQELLAGLLPLVAVAALAAGLITGAPAAGLRGGYQGPEACS